MRCTAPSSNASVERSSVALGGKRLSPVRCVNGWWQKPVSISCAVPFRGNYTRGRFQACLPHVQRFLCRGHRKRVHLYTLVCRWLGTPATDAREELPMAPLPLLPCSSPSTPPLC